LAIHYHVHWDGLDSDQRVGREFGLHPGIVTAISSSQTHGNWQPPRLNGIQPSRQAASQAIRGKRVSKKVLVDFLRGGRVEAILQRRQQ
jgi:hypothetical protein